MSLRELRRKIDELDSQLLELVAKRIALVRQIADLKLARKMKIRDDRREQEILARVREKAVRVGLDQEFADLFMRLIMSRAVGEELLRTGGVKFWAEIDEAFKGYPAELAVIKVLFSHGLRVDEGGNVRCGEMRIPLVQIASVAGTDRRTVEAAIKRTLSSKKLRAIFENLRPIPSLRDVGRQMGWGVTEIIPRDARELGVLKEIVEVISKAGISIRQAIADDPHLVPLPKLTLLTDRPLPGKVIEKLSGLPSVYSVLIY